jgi:hypothetical protein
MILRNEESIAFLSERTLYKLGSLTATLYRIVPHAFLVILVLHRTASWLRENPEAVEIPERKN